MTLIAPAGAVSADVSVTMSMGGQHPPVAANRDMGIFFNLTARTADGHPVTRFAKPLGLRVRYAPGADHSSHGLFYSDIKIGAWQRLPTSDDVSAGVLTAITDHFTQFGVLSAPTACPIPVGNNAPSPAIKTAFEQTAILPNVAAEIGCATTDVQPKYGVWVQYFDNDSLIIYKAGQPKAFYIGPGYKEGYEAKGGASGFLGMPIENSTDAQNPPQFYTGFGTQPIQLFEQGFVGYNGIDWVGAYHFPKSCQ